MSSKLFVFGRPLPAPFDKVKKKVKVSSKYGDGTEATLCHDLSDFSDALQQEVKRIREQTD